MEARHACRGSPDSMEGRHACRGSPDSMEGRHACRGSPDSMEGRHACRGSPDSGHSGDLLGGADLGQAPKCSTGRTHMALRLSFLTTHNTLH